MWHSWLTIFLTISSNQLVYCLIFFITLTILSGFLDTPWSLVEYRILVEILVEILVDILLDILVDRAARQVEMPTVI